MLCFYLLLLQIQLAIRIHIKYTYEITNNI